MTRAALYARYSSDNQREASIEDQFRLCREHAARERWQIVGSYEDAAISGASIGDITVGQLLRESQLLRVKDCGARETVVLVTLRDVSLRLRQQGSDLSSGVGAVVRHAI